jgi:hypothetical protein
MQELFTRAWFRWLIGFIALVATVIMASYQRRTGPTWPIPVRETLAGSSISGELIRTQAGEGDAEVGLTVASASVSGEIVWRRYPTEEAWTHYPMERQGEMLVAKLPHQPAAAKLEYSVRLQDGDEELVLPPDETAIIRYRDDVPAWVLIPHILFMFASLWIVFRAALGALLVEAEVRRFIPWILGFLIPGGFLLGPLVQKYAFDAYWTGWPFGGDWTDNKTLAALVAWLIAWALAHYRPQLQRAAVILGTVVMIGVYLIPHSLHGSELDWSQMEAETASPGTTTREDSN